MNFRTHDEMELEKARESVSELKQSPLRFFITLLAMVVLIAICVIAGTIPRLNRQSELGAEVKNLSLQTVAVVSPKPGSSGGSLPLPAEIRPWVEAPIYARANGYLKRRFVDIGQHVKEGQLLAEIDTPELNQELERARAQLAQAQAALGLAKITSTRWADLLKTASVSEQENAEKQADFKLKKAICDSAAAEVRRIEKLQSFGSICAPFSGTITIRNIDSGDLISAAAGKELFHLVQTQKLRVFVPVPQAMAPKISYGQAAEMNIPEFSDRVFQARVIRTAGVIAPDSRTLLVELEAENSRNEILAGGYAQVRFKEAKEAAALTIPSNAVMFRSEGPQIGIVGKDGKVELRKAKLGRDFGQAIEILGGVDPNEQVILNPSDSIAAGCIVRVSETQKLEKVQ